MSQDASGLFLLQQRDFNSYDTLAEAVASITYPTEGKEIFIISENKYYYWNGTTWVDQAVLFSTSAPDIGTLYCQEVSGTTTIVFQGTGSWTSATNNNCVIRNNININTAGTITIGGNGNDVQFNTGTLTYTSGTVTTTGSTLRITASTTLDTDRGGGNKISWNNISTPTTSSTTITLTTDLTCINYTLTANNVTFNSSNFYISGSVTLNVAGGIMSGTTNIVLNGTGTWSNSGSTCQLRNNLTINTAGTITISGTVYYNTGTLTYTSGTVTTTGSTLTIGVSTTLNTNGDSSSSATTTSTTGINWNNVALSGNITVTNTGNLTIIGTYSNGSGSSDTIGGTIYCLGNISVTGTSLGSASSAPIIIHGTASQTISGTGTLRHSLNINKSGGTLSITGILYGIGTITYTAGTVTTSGTLTIMASCTLNTNGDSSASATTTSSTGINWNNVALNTGLTITNSSNLTILGSLSTGAGLTGIINGNNIYLHGNLLLNGTLTGTGTTLVFRGSTNQSWSGGGSVLTATIDVNKSGGTLTLGTVSTSVATGNTLTNTSSSEIIILAPFVTLQNSNINWPGVIWPTISTDGFVTFTLNHDLIIKGNLGLRYSLALTGVYNVYVGGSVTTYESGDLTGTATVIMNGTGLLAGRNQFQSDLNSSAHYMRIYCNFKIETEGTITVGNLQMNGTGRTYEYVKGNIVTNLATDRQFPTHNSTLSIAAITSTFLNFNKIKFKNVSISSTITANTMFEGTAKIPCNISGGGTINFSDRLEKISRFIKIRNITIGNRGQLLVTYANANKGSNNGIRFKGDLPTGINKVTNTIVPINVPSYGYGNGMLSDPATISNI